MNVFENYFIDDHVHLPGKVFKNPVVNQCLTFVKDNKKSLIAAQGFESILE